MLLFATAESGMHECFAINYELPGFAVGAILYIDTDQGGAITLAADSFDDFINRLAPDPDEIDNNNDDDEAEHENTALEGVLRGSLAPDLQLAVDEAPRSDAETLVRAAARPIAEGPGFQLKNNESGRTFLDVLFWLTSQRRPVHSPGDFAGIADDAGIPNFVTLTVKSFRINDKAYSMLYSLWPFKAWWKDRQERGLLTAVDDGYRLDEAYLQKVFDLLSTPPQGRDSSTQTQGPSRR